MAQRPWSRAGRMGLGFGWLLVQSRKRPPFVWHGGGTYGFRSFAAFVPGRDVAVVVLRNAARSVDRLGLALLDAALDRR
jgi:CubicO group peptidase (beta-lactamase class C family)